MKGEMLARAATLAAALAVALGAAPAPAAPVQTFRLGDQSCSLIAVPTGHVAAVGTGPCPGVRPGAMVRTDKGYCTLNFLFRGSDGNRYIGTAGHCILGEDATDREGGEHVWPRYGPSARDAKGEAIGDFAYAILDSPKDFALIRLYPWTKAHAAMCAFGGPVRMSKDRTSPEVLRYYGQGTAFADVVPGRTAIAMSLASPDHIYAYGAIAPGDSGAGIMSDTGGALGLIVTVGVHIGGIRDAGIMGITRLPPQVARAERALGIDLRVRKAGLQA